MAKGERGKYDHWPKKDKLKDAVDTFEKFRDICVYQMEVGYWATIDFPTKHHINRILSLQYLEKDLLEKVYGKGLVDRVFNLIPYCRNYVLFVREAKEDKNEKGKGNSSSATSS